MNAIQIENLHYAYRSDWLFKRVGCLHDVNLVVQAGEAFGFLGHNGAGKTTTIKCLLNLIRPTKGSIKLFGLDSQLIESRHAVGYLPEQPYFYDHLSVYETLEMYAALAAVPNNKKRPAVLTALEQVGMTDRLKSKMRSLSKGLTQRVALAQALVAKPRLLILDEPFSGLDPLGRKEFSDIFFELKKSGTTLFMSSHILSDVEALCDRVSIMVKGRLEGIFAIDQISSLTPGSFEIAIKLPANNLDKLPAADSTTQSDRILKLSYQSAEVAKKALQLALEQEITIESYKFNHGGLEELFVKLVSQHSKERISA